MLRADVAGRVGLVEGGGDALLGQGHLAPDVEEGLAAADRVAGEQDALDQLVGIALHEDAVLVGAGLALVAVDDEVAGPHAGRAEAPLDAGREAGAAPTEEAGRLDLVDHRGRGHGQRLAQGLVAAGGLVAGQGVRVVVAEAAGDDLRRVGDHLGRLGRCGIGRSRGLVGVQPDRLAIVVGRHRAGAAVGRDASGAPGPGCRAGAPRRRAGRCGGRRSAGRTRRG